MLNHDVYFLLNCVIFNDSCTSFNKFYSFITFSFLINAVILLLNCLVLNILSSHTFSLSLLLFSLLKHYLHLYMNDTICSESLWNFILYHLYPMVLRTISPCCSPGMGFSDAILNIMIDS